MTLQEFINKEKENNTLTGYALDSRIKDLQNSKKHTIEIYKHDLTGFIYALHATNYINKETWEQLHDDIQNIWYKRFNELYNLD